MSRLGSESANQTLAFKWLLRPQRQAGPFKLPVQLEFELTPFCAETSWSPAVLLTGVMVEYLWGPRCDTRQQPFYRALKNFQVKLKVFSSFRALRLKARGRSHSGPVVRWWWLGSHAAANGLVTELSFLSTVTRTDRHWRDLNFLNLFGFKLSDLVTVTTPILAQRWATRW